MIDTSPYLVLAIAVSALGTAAIAWAITSTRQLRATRKETP